MRTIPKAYPVGGGTRLVVVLFLVAIGLLTVTGFVPVSQNKILQKQPLSLLAGSRAFRDRVPYCLYARDEDSWSEDDEEEEEEEEIPDVSDQDWRAFRAKLVMTEPDRSSEKSTEASPAIVEEDDLDGIGAVFQSAAGSSVAETEQSSSEATSSSFATMTPLDPSQWAYDSGKVIEQGAVILGGVEQDYGFGLRQQYFHKAAILVLDHDENQFTKGIILNRPTDLLLEDDVNEGVQWRVWFGGDVQGLNSPNPDIVCLHSLKNKEAMRASITVMNDIQWTTFDNAKRLVKSGVASPSDFWVFCGYAGWGPGQLMGELDRKSWYMVATDSQTLLKELARQSAGADPRDAGLDTWELLMNMIGRGETAEECSGDFDDLIIKEWARENLLSSEAGGGAGMQKRSPEGMSSAQELLRADPVDQVMKRVSEAVRGEEVAEGSLLRASPNERSPFLLNNQDLHKAVVLIISEDENISVGVILNRPAAKGLDMQITDKSSSASKSVTIPLRYGGQYAVKGQEPLLWLHCDQRLRAARIGSEVGFDKGGIWKCTAEDVTAAIAQGLAKPEDFIVVSGVSVWAKGEVGVAPGIRGEIQRGHFESIPAWRTEDVWKALLKQEVLTNLNIAKITSLANDAWEAGSRDKDTKNGDEKSIPIGGLGEGFDEEDDTLVFKSDVKVSKLSDDALRSWIATFLLGAPSLGTI